MADRKFSPFPILKQPKFPVYETLYKLNLAFESLAAEIEHLRDSKAITPDTLNLYHVTAEELRAAVNNRITEVLHLREDKDWNHYGKELRKAQERLKAKRK